GPECNEIAINEAHLRHSLGKWQCWSRKTIRCEREEIDDPARSEAKLRAIECERYRLAIIHHRAARGRRADRANLIKSVSIDRKDPFCARAWIRAVNSAASTLRQRRKCL